MISRYGIFCRVVELCSFTKTAEQLKYSQSAVSQTIKSLEQEVGTVLIRRKKDGIELTKDGIQYFPYIQAIYQAETAFMQKQMEMDGLTNSTIRIGTFTSVSRNLLPKMMKSFKELYPDVDFILQQGEYTSIATLVRNGSVDFGFINQNAEPDLESKILYQDEMVAVLPPGHPLAAYDHLTLEQLAEEAFILLDEGDYSVPLNAFQKRKLSPRIEYKVYDDYSILAMVKEKLGVSILYRLVVNGFEEGLEIRPVEDKMERVVALAWNNWETMPLAARRFAEYIIKNTSQQEELMSQISSCRRQRI